MRILILDEEFPFPTNTGKRTRSFNLYRRLANKFRIRYVAYGSGNSASASALREHGIEVVAVPAKVRAKRGVGFYVRLLQNLFSSYPYIVASHFSDLYLSVVGEQIVDLKPDLILCEWTPYSIYVKDIAGIGKLVSAHNVEADIWKRYFENEANALRRWYIGKQWHKVATFERTAMNWVDGVVAVSESDCSRLLDGRTGLGAWVVPNGVDLDFFVPICLPIERNQLVFVGSMDWRPNQDAARFFAKQILPLLHQRRSDVECCFVGRDPPSEIRLLSSKAGLSITGTVDDVRPYVARATVFVVPLRVGGGSRLKILEAFAMGRPVVSTTIGAEGLDVIDGRHIVIADTPEEFANAVLRLLDSRELCETLALEARKLVESRYGWDALADHFARCINEVSLGRGGIQASHMTAAAKATNAETRSANLS